MLPYFVNIAFLNTAEDPVSAASDQTVNLGTDQTGNLGTDQTGNLGTGLSITSTMGQMNIAGATIPPGGDGAGETTMPNEDVMTASPPDTAGETALPGEDMTTASAMDGTEKPNMPSKGM